MKFYQLSAAVFLLAGCCCGESLKPGINRTNLPWVKPETRQFEILDEIHALGAGSVRLSLVQPHDAVWRHIKRCNELGMEVVLFIPNGETDLYFNPGVPIREGNGDKYGIYSLPHFSKMNVDRFMTMYTYYLQQLKQRGLKVKALQLFNELNWCAFNGDMPMVDGGAIVTKDNWREHAFFPQWVEGMKIYGEVMKRVRAETDRMFADKPALKPQVLTYGVAKVWDRYVEENRGTCIRPDLAVQVMCGQHELTKGDANIFNYADAVATHIYPDNPTLEPEEGIKRIENYAAQMIDPLVAAAGKDKPVYITEWGVAGAWFDGYPEDDTKRLEWFGLFLRALQGERFKDIDFGEIMLFDYDHMPPFSIYQEGRQLDSCRFFKKACFKRER